ncbi:MAG: hypothetical protein KO254_04225 [Methanoculleus marisnigri]|nr:hypothetical protein [Methanoculleus marisnigri]
MGIFDMLFRTGNAFGVKGVKVPKELIDVANTHDFCHYTINTRNAVTSPPNLVSTEIIQKLLPFPDDEGHFRLNIPQFNMFELHLTPDNDVIFCTVYSLDKEKVPVVTFASMLSVAGMDYSAKMIVDMIASMAQDPVLDDFLDEWITKYKLDEVDNLFQGVSPPACLVCLHPFITCINRETMLQLVDIERTITRAWFTHYALLHCNQYQMIEEMGLG